MKIFGNIKPLIKLAYALRYLREYKNEILTARAAGDIQGEQAAILKATASWGKQVVNLFQADIHVKGREYLPAKGPVVYVANHQGDSDIPVCCAVLNTVQTGFLAKSSLLSVPLYGEWIKTIRSVMIDRDNARASLRAIDEGINLINQGFSMVIFPEGTRSKGKPIGEFKKGSLRLATKTGAPVIPITINGTYKIFEETGRIRSGVHVDFIIHPPIETKGLDRAAATNLLTDVEKIIKDTYAKL